MREGGKNQLNREPEERGLLGVNLHDLGGKAPGRNGFEMLVYNLAAPSGGAIEVGDNIAGPLCVSEEILLVLKLAILAVSLGQPLLLLFVFKFHKPQFLFAQYFEVVGLEGIQPSNFSINKRFGLKSCLEKLFFLCL